MMYERHSKVKGEYGLEKYRIRFDMYDHGARSLIDGRESVAVGKAEKRKGGNAETRKRVLPPETYVRCTLNPYKVQEDV